MNSRWQANKIGLINFWYYDDQEFSFVKGRMLLRGSNGSGKSVTMQSVVPLLLDGNMSPERLDPFGSRDRKMSSYLLEEDDEREERTGYLYLEFKRRESETYLTIGMGIRARKGKPLDKWYFSLSDGRRIGKDFFLYKETDERVTLSKRELENRIQEGGQVFDRQLDYMDYVRRQIFGFETLDEYKEMLDLLIQLRTPKLSKDFKPSVINDILSDSLQPLSDEDLRPMSEAIENMDVMNMNLKNRLEGKQAAEKINRVLDKYNRLMLYQKASDYVENEQKLSELEKEEQKRQQSIEVCEKNVEKLEEEKHRLNAKKEALEKEKDSLNKSDAVALKARELELMTSITSFRQQVGEKEKQLEIKQGQHVDLCKKQKEEQNKEEQKEQELQSLLEEMQEEADEMAFEEHAFFEDELKLKWKETYDFTTHLGQMKKIQEGITRGCEILARVDAKQREVEELLQKKEQYQREIDKAEKRHSELETVKAQVQNEWTEALYAWNGSNTELKLDKEKLKSIAHFAEEYGIHSDFTIVKNAVSDVYFDNKGKIVAAKSQQIEKRLQADILLKEAKEELSQWENHKEPVPERSASVNKNRDRLRMLGIPFQEFYKVVEFGEHLDKKNCDRLEEALLAMGILDALVVDESYKEQVLAFEEGSSDRYLFIQKQKPEKSLLDVLDLDESFNDIFFNQRLTGLLSCIAYEAEGTTSVSPDGNYRMGLLYGTVTGEYEAGFIGVQARERYRQGKITACQENIKQIQEELRIIEETIAELTERQKLLDEEYEKLPEDKDLREVCHMLEDVLREIRQSRTEIEKLEEKLIAMSLELKEWKKEATEIAGKLYLACSLPVFQKADHAARSYEKMLYQVKAGHETFLQILAHMEDLQERLEEIDADMEQIRYDAGIIARMCKKEEEEHASILEQLKLTDYEQIKERLDQCILWLKNYPSELELCVANQKEQEEQKKNAIEWSKQCVEKIAEYRTRAEYLEKRYLSELELGYVVSPNEWRGEAKRLAEMLLPDSGRLEKDSVNSELNRVYFENRGFLNEYQLMQTEIFREIDETAARNVPTSKRLDITARYQGVKMPFSSLLIHLNEDIEHLNELIKNGDRELFEDILSNTVSRKIRGKIHNSEAWVDKMNRLMSGMNTSSGLKLSLRWRSRTAENENQLDTRELVELLKKDYRLMREDEVEKLSLHFRSKVEEARRHAKDSGGMISFYQVMKDTLDYRKWFEFQLFAQKSGEKVKELTNSVFGTFSGGEKAMSMYVPLFSAVVAKYQGGRADAPRLISLDEAFAGVDNRNIRDMFRLMTEFEFDFIINSQVLWGDCDTLDALGIYQLLRPENAKFVTVMPYLWNGKSKELMENEEEMELRAAEYTV